MLEINRKSNDRVHDIAACARGSSAHAELQRFLHQPTADTLGKIFTKFPLGVTHCGGLHARALFNSALVYVAEVRIHSMIMRPRVLHALHCTVYRDLAMSRSFVVVFFFFFFWVSWIRIFWMRFRIVVFPSDFRNKYDFFVTVGSSASVKRIYIHVFSIIILPICININLFCHCVNIFSKSSVSYWLLCLFFFIISNISSIPCKICVKTLLKYHSV